MQDVFLISLGSLEMIVLDTHAWIWFISNPDLLSKRAKKAVNAAVKDKSILISSISAWELALLVTKKRMKLTLDVTDWIAIFNYRVAKCLQSVLRIFGIGTIFKTGLPRSLIIILCRFAQLPENIAARAA